MDLGEEEFEVEKILDFAETREGPRYLIKWKNYGPESNSWEPVENLSCDDLLSEFHEKHAAPRSGRKESNVRRPMRVVETSEESDNDDKKPVVGSSKSSSSKKKRIKKTKRDHMNDANEDTSDDGRPLFRSRKAPKKPFPYKVPSTKDGQYRIPKKSAVVASSAAGASSGGRRKNSQSDYDVNQIASLLPGGLVKLEPKGVGMLTKRNPRVDNDSLNLDTSSQTARHDSIDTHEDIPTFKNVNSNLFSPHTLKQHAKLASTVTNQPAWESTAWAPNIGGVSSHSRLESRSSHPKQKEQLFDIAPSPGLPIPDGPYKRSVQPAMKYDDMEFQDEISQDFPASTNDAAIITGDQCCALYRFQNRKMIATITLFDMHCHGAAKKQFSLEKEYYFYDGYPCPKIGELFKMQRPYALFRAHLPDNSASYWKTYSDLKEGSMAYVSFSSANASTVSILCHDSDDIMGHLLGKDDRIDPSLYLIVLLRVNLGDIAFFSRGNEENEVMREAGRYFLEGQQMLIFDADNSTNDKELLLSDFVERRGCVETRGRDYSDLSFVFVHRQSILRLGRLPNFFELKRHAKIQFATYGYGGIPAFNTGNNYDIIFPAGGIVTITAHCLLEEQQAEELLENLEQFVKRSDEKRPGSWLVMMHPVEIEKVRSITTHSGKQGDRLGHILAKLEEIQGEEFYRQFAPNQVIAHPDLYLPLTLERVSLEHALRHRFFFLIDTKAYSSPCGLVEVLTVSAFNDFIKEYEYNFDKWLQ